MRNVLNLGTFEYGKKAKWATLFTALSFAVLLLFPSVALATSIPRQTSTRAVPGNPVTWNMTSSLNRVGGLTRGTNNHSTNSMRLRVQAFRLSGNVISFSRYSNVSRNSSGKTLTQLGCSLRIPNQWRAEIQPVNGRQWTGSATLHRTQ